MSNNHHLTLSLLTDNYAVHRLPAKTAIPAVVFTSDYYFIAKTIDELSIVIPQTLSIQSDAVEADWKVLKIIGPLDFSLTGILAKISTILANNQLSIFAISTYDTDYILVKSHQINTAITVLKEHNYQITEE
jgi:hypothetical protein